MEFRTYRNIRAELIALGYSDEISWSQAVLPPVDAIAFAEEYVWVVLNSGMKNQVARKIADRVYPALANGVSARTVFKHPGKSAAIDQMWGRRQEFFERYTEADDKLEFCQTLPWIGPITKFHLAKNLGADVAKPDRWLERVANSANETVNDLCQRLSLASGDRVATVDLVIWRACNLGVHKVVA